MYGAFGVPVALLLWINFTAKLLLFCAAWTATRKATAEAADEETATTASPLRSALSADARAGPPGPAAAAAG